MANIKKIYICHPYTGDPEGNCKKVKEITEEIGKSLTEHQRAWSRALRDGETEETFPPVLLPLSAFLAFPSTMCEPATTRRFAMINCIALLSTCDELWVYDRTISDGMAEEIEYASNNQIPVIWKV